MSKRVGSAVLAALLLTALLSVAGCEFFGGVDPNHEEIPASFVVQLTIATPDQSAVDAAPVEDGERVVELPAEFVPVNLATELPALAQRQGDIRAVRITAVTETIQSNTLDVSLDPIELRVGEPDGSFDSAEALGSTEAVGPRTTGVLPASVTEVGRARASNHMLDLNFGVGLSTSLRVPEDYVVSNAGEAALAFEFEIVVTAEDE
jgi:hypothetical protein